MIAVHVFLALLGCFCSSVVTHGNAEIGQPTGNQQELMTSVLLRLTELEQQSYQQAQEIDRQAQEIDRQAHTILQLTDENRAQAEAIQTLTAQDRRQDELIQASSGSRTSVVNPEPDTRSMFAAFACTGTNVSLACPDSRTILVTSGNYGQFQSTCSSCCAPNPQYDCTEVVEENSPQDWFAIQQWCDNKTSCEFVNQGSGVNDCEEGALSDYMQLFYECLPEDDAGPVGFTAYADTGSPTGYTVNDIVVFEQVITNFDGHYNPATSSFTCPVDGVYLLSVSVQAYVGVSFFVYLMRNTAGITQVYADNVSGAYTRGSTTAVTECSRGEVLWVKATQTRDLDARERYCVFTGHLIFRL